MHLGFPVPIGNLSSDIRARILVELAMASSKRSPLLPDAQKGRKALTAARSRATPLFNRRGWRMNRDDWYEAAEDLTRRVREDDTKESRCTLINNMMAMCNMQESYCRRINEEGES
jgi:hypothetical protein